MTTSMSNRCERTTAMLKESGTSRKDNAKPILRRSRTKGVSTNQVEVQRQLEDGGSRHTQGRAEHNPLGLPTGCRRGDPTVTIDLGPDQAHHDPQEHQERNSLQGGRTRVQVRKLITGNQKSAERNSEPACPARHKPSAGEEKEEQCGTDRTHNLHAPDGQPPGRLGGEQGVRSRRVDRNRPKRYQKQ